MTFVKIPRKLYESLMNSKAVMIPLHILLTFKAVGFPQEPLLEVSGQVINLCLAVRSYEGPGHRQEVVFSRNKK